jgi:N-acylglucosamine 2-epimerase
MKTLQRYFYDELVNDTIRFWTEHAVDRRYGGFSTFLDREGKPLCTDKAMWIQSRFTWMLARLYNDLEKRQEWLALAAHGAAFIRKYGFDDDGRMFFIVTEDGRPLRKRRYLFTEIFGIIALAEFARAAGDSDALSLAEKTMELVLRLYGDPGALEPKIMPETRTTRSHSMAMIRINTFQVLRSAGGAGDYDALIDDAIDEVFTFFVKPEKKALFETVGPDGGLLDSPEGRCINPGHALETAWFILEEGRARRDEALVRRALPLIDWSLSLGWDTVHGGILYFVDIEGKQPEQLEWDMKLWWVHNEAIYAALLAHHLSGEARYLDWFEKLLDYSTKYFPDREHGEWFGYLHRDGTVALTLKGSHWKGPFHLPRQQLCCHLLLSRMLNGERPFRKELP